MDQKDSDKKILYRFKQRLSLILYDNKDYKISIDITDVKTSDNIKSLLLQNSLYEVEIDLTVKNSKNTNRISLYRPSFTPGQKL